MNISDFDYKLPLKLIAQSPLADRTGSRLLVVSRESGRIRHRTFPDLAQYLVGGDVLVINETRVRPSRLIGHKETGGRVELLLLDELRADVWLALAKPARRMPAGTALIFSEELRGEVIEVRDAGERVVRFTSRGPVSEVLEQTAALALPPYIHSALGEPGRYQTVYAAEGGSVAAPTAGLHFSKDLLTHFEDAGVEIVRITLDIGLDTFRPVAVESLEDHVMHSERYEISADAARSLAAARARHARVAAVGTTTVRALESWTRAPEAHGSGPRRTDLFIKPGFNFMMTDMMLTNFHLPKSTLLVMISAFAGTDLVRRAYEEAVSEAYRFYSFGDAMLII